MSVSLQKGQKVSLSKDNAGLSSILVGLGWNESKFGKAQKKTEKKKQEVFSNNASYDIDKYEKDLVALRYLDNEE